jgi:mRNA interferase MazF
MKRGEVWSLQDDDFASKPRPVIIVQDSLSTEFDSVILCMFTTYDSEGIPTRTRIEPTRANGLKKTSYVMTEKLLTINRMRLGIKIGALTNQDMRTISGQLAKVLGITKGDLIEE